MIWKLENGLHEPSTNRLMEEEMPMGSLVWCPFHARYAERAEVLLDRIYG
jgi:hypothetical protein